MTKTLKIGGFDFTVATPYAAGHPLTAIEAAVLNQTYAENVRNNVASRLKAAKEANEKAGTEFNIDVHTAPEAEGGEPGPSVRAQLQSYADAYAFAERTAANREPVDPVEREAKRIATDAINAQMTAKGLKKKDLPEGAYDSAVEKLMKAEKTVAEAKRRVKEREKIGGETLDLEALGIGGPSEPEAPAE